MLGRGVSCDLWFGGFVGLTHDEFDGEPEPCPGNVLGLGAVGGNFARVDGAADYGHRDGDQGQGEDSAEDQLLPYGEADFPQNDDGKAEN